MSITLPSKDPDNVEPYFVVWCSEDNTNDGTTSDKGELQGATISSFSVSASPGTINIDSTSKTAVTVAGVTYGVNTVATMWLSSGVVNTDYSINCRVVTSDSRTLDQTIIVPIRAH